MSSHQTSRITTPPKTLQERIKYAVEHRTAYVVGDENTAKIAPPTFDEYDDEEDVRKGVILYEGKVEKVLKRLEEEKRLEREKRKAERIREIEAELAELRANILTDGAPESSKTAQKRPLFLPGASNEENTSTSTKKRVRIAEPEEKGPGEEINPPCDRCSGRKTCHQQIPPQISCFECKKARQSCPLVTSQKAIPKNPTRKPRKVVDDVESEEDVTCRATSIGTSDEMGQAILQAKQARNRIEARKADALAAIAKTLDVISCLL